MDKLPQSLQVAKITAQDRVLVTVEEDASVLDLRLVHRQQVLQLWSVEDDVSLTAHQSFVIHIDELGIGAT